MIVVLEKRRQFEIMVLMMETFIMVIEAFVSVKERKMTIGIFIDREV